MENERRIIGDISGAERYEVTIKFTKRQNPVSISEQGIPFVSLGTEIEANSFSLDTNSPSQIATDLHEQYGRIPYSAPIYSWELENNCETELLYIGQTTRQQIQKRFEGHNTVMRLLAQYVNDPQSLIYYRLCSQLKFKYESNGEAKHWGIEHFPLEQASKLIDDIEAFLIYRFKPRYNTHYVNNEKEYWKPFSYKFKSRIYEAS